MAAENGFAEGFTRACVLASMRPRRMAAENWIAQGPCSEHDIRFNEAAAHGRGKLRGRSFFRSVLLSFNEAAAHGRGKLRGSSNSVIDPRASMRPRRMAAENERGEFPLNEHLFASMRPRRMAAENSYRSNCSYGSGPSFNEAAAHGRGKPWPRSRRARPAPRFNEAAAHGRGKQRPRPRKASAGNGFNEAAAHGRGKRSPATSKCPASACFNEAAAHGRGKLPGQSPRGPGLAAGFNEAAAHGRGKPRGASRRSRHGRRLQ